MWVFPHLLIDFDLKLSEIVAVVGMSLHASYSFVAYEAAVAVAFVDF